MSSSDQECSAGSASCNFTCPSGGTWYACPDEPYFLGCCSSDPCTNSNTTSPCPDVYAASFNPSIFDSISPNTCVNSSSNKWYSCNHTSPPFLGCCSSNPCEKTHGCPKEDIIASSWSQSRSDQFALFKDGDDGGESGEGGDGGDSGGNSLSGGAIAGIVVGCVAGVAILIFAVWFLSRRRKKRQAPAEGTPAIAVSQMQSMYPEEYLYQSQTSPYQGWFLSPFPFASMSTNFYPSLESFSSPGTTVGGKYPSGSEGFSRPSISQHRPSESGRPTSDVFSNAGSDENPRHTRSSSQNKTLGVFDPQNPETIPELDGTERPPPEPPVYELEGKSQP